MKVLAITTGAVLTLVLSTLPGSSKAMDIEGKNVGDSIQFAVPVNSVTQEQYYKYVVQACHQLRLHPKDYAWVKRIKVLNKFAHDGYVFTGGVKECVDVLREPYTDKADIKNAQFFYILSKTRYQ